jgi:hypothetical protein
MARSISRAGAITMVLCAYWLAGHVLGYVVDERRADAVRAACLLYQATQTATGLLVGDGPQAAPPTHRYWIEAQAGRQALTEARVECR